jgi:hypothetical protein
MKNTAPQISNVDERSTQVPTDGCGGIRRTPTDGCGGIRRAPTDGCGGIR